jgi:hypothetical protein
MCGKMKKKQYFDKYLKLLLLPQNAELNGQQVWIKLEAQHICKYGVCRYKSYNSFKKEKSKYYSLNR